MSHALINNSAQLISVSPTQKQNQNKVKPTKKEEQQRKLLLPWTPPRLTMPPLVPPCTPIFSEETLACVCVKKVNCESRSFLLLYMKVALASWMTQTRRNRAAAEDGSWRWSRSWRRSSSWWPDIKLKTNLPKQQKKHKLANKWEAVRAGDCTRMTLTSSWCLAPSFFAFCQSSK